MPRKLYVVVHEDVARACAEDELAIQVIEEIERGDVYLTAHVIVTFIYLIVILTLLFI